MADERNKIEYGGRTFTQEQIKSGNVHLAMSLPMTTLEANTFEATVQSAEDLTDFERLAPLRYYHDGRLQGIYYVQDIVRTNPGLYEISAISAVGLLSEDTHMGGIYTGQNAESVIDSVCGNIPHYVKSELKNIQINGWLPIATRRDNLMQVLFALGACLKTDLDGYLRIEYLWDGVSSSQGPDRIYTGARPGQTAKVTQVSVTEHAYSPGTDERELFNGTAVNGDIVTFGEPMHSLEATGFTILESGPNYAKISAGVGRLVGKTYIHTTRQITRNIAAADKPKTEEVTDATLISMLNSAAAADRLANYYRAIQTTDGSVVMEEEAPGDIVSVYHPYDDKMVLATLQSADITLSNVLKSQETGAVGYVPSQPEETGAYDTVVVLTGSGTWVVPDGVTHIDVVLIGGGQGGHGGENGRRAGARNGTIGIPADDPQKNPSAQILQENTGGAGGVGGSGGLGGKILRASMDVTAAQLISYAAGAGGAGGEVGADGALGGNTIFGTYNSANGASSESGYIDLIRGTQYALSGSEGYAGGAGGGMSSASDNLYVSLPGENVAEWSGGITGGYNDHAGGGAGGGAAYGSNGGAGYPPPEPYNGNIYVNGVHYDWVPIYSNGGGGNGADATAGTTATVYGCGGGGGHGGGGGGTPGACAIGKGMVAMANAYAGNGGKGSAGGKGADGCVLVYYHIPRRIETGQFLTKDSKMLVGSNYKRFIV